MLLEKMDWMDVERYLQHDRRIVFVLGSTEQHGYLSLLTDTLIPWEIAKKACELENVLLAPPLNYGYSQWAVDYPGTLSIGFDTYHHMVQDIIKSALRAGFQSFLLLNGHGGNRGAREAVMETISDFPGVRVWFTSWWELPETAAFLTEHGGMDHANWSENFTFTRLKDVPPGEILERMPQYNQSPSDYRKDFPLGITGGRYQLPDEITETLFEIAIKETIGLLRAMNDQ